MYFCYTRVDINKYTIIIILYYFFMIDLPQHAYMLQCYKCYNTTESASEGTVEGVHPKHQGVFGEMPKHFS